MVESLLLAVTRIATLSGDTVRTHATGFFFARDERLYLITNRHVVRDEASGHLPDALRINLHTDPHNVVRTTAFRIPLYCNGQPVWHHAHDAGGPVDVVALELDRRALPPSLALQAFTPNHLLTDLHTVEVGTPVLIPGFPLGFHDTLHRLPVVRQALVATSFGLRFQGKGYFLTDARLHRGASGAPVVVRHTTDASGRGSLDPWCLLGIHAARMDVASRDDNQDDRLSLNIAWYADILRKLTAAPQDTTVLVEAASALPSDA